MSLIFDSAYYNGIGYPKYQNYPHFALRAQWIYNQYISRNLSGDIWIIGCGWGWVIKELLSLVPTNAQSKIKGVVFSQYEYDKAINIVGLTSTNIEKVDADTKIFPTMDICISWNFFDSLPNDDLKVQRIVDKFVSNAIMQLHIICVTDNDPSAQRYIDQGYYIQSVNYWATKFQNLDASIQDAFFVEYATGKVWKKTVSGWSNSSLLVPLSWGRVSL